MAACVSLIVNKIREKCKFNLLSLFGDISMITRFLGIRQVPSSYEEQLYNRYYHSKQIINVI